MAIYCDRVQAVAMVSPVAWWVAQTSEQAGGGSCLVLLHSGFELMGGERHVHRQALHLIMHQLIQLRLSRLSSTAQHSTAQHKLSAVLSDE